ncbi:single-stranded DNA-binding protein [Paenarthrobacter aromaticivorans]|uniref:Single-stranded DNA-binding protein n=1 Tax=Paenarthrobacter aromaticivorans TaxID=2849150 RepID=A0ABS6ICU3_9MICC|nr:single-stranded DNA-binding protein [Paenarthrobacter sp. MMS21-TAE1-1]MBU8869192.1 single-stranded DNA-binding protein [Paenarthrobacter sp. MMS21-TAE1-1]
MTSTEAFKAWEAEERFRLSGRRQDDLEEFGRIANPSARINVPVTDPYNDAAAGEDYGTAPAGDAPVMPGLPDWPVGTALGYPFTDTPATHDLPGEEGSGDVYADETQDEPEAAAEPTEAPASGAGTRAGESVTVIGNLVADPRLKELGSGSVVANFTIASTPRVFDETTQQWKDGKTVFLRASAWNDTGRHASASLTKGSRVIAVGRIKSRTFEGKDGRSRTVEELVVEDVAVSLRFQTAAIDRGHRRAGEDRAAG